LKYREKKELVNKHTKKKKYQDQKKKKTNKNVNILKKEGQKKEKVFSIIKKQQISRFGILFFKLLIVKFEEKKKGRITP